MSNRTTYTSGGIGLGSVLAAIFSLLINKSVFWAIIHGIFGWFYLLFLCMGGNGGFAAVDQAINELENPQSVQVEED